MAEDVARAVGAKGPGKFEINGKECIPRALGIREITEVERECVAAYKREIIRTYADNVDVIPNGQALLEKKIEEVSRYDVTKLPPRNCHDPKRVKITPRLRAWMSETVTGFEEAMSMKGDADKETFERALVATSLDNGMLDPHTYEAMVGELPRMTRIPYVSWWVSSSFDGMVTMIWIAFRDQGITKADIIAIVSENKAKLADMAQTIEGLTAPDVGN